MCNNTVEADACLLKFVPACFRTDCLKVVAKRKAQKVKLKRELLGIHQDGGIGVFLRTTRRRQKNYGAKQETFLCVVTGYKSCFRVSIKFDPP